MANHHLSFSSDSINVRIKNYEPYRFNHNGWTVSDNYIHDEKKLLWPNYSIIAISPSIRNEEELYDYRNEGQIIVDMVTSLIPLCGLPSLNSPKYQDFEKDIFLCDYKNSPMGWRTNYNEMKNEFEAISQQHIKARISALEIFRYSNIEKSPLEEMELMMNKYKDISVTIKYLLYLYNSILCATSLNVYMLIGKALEIINALYPKNSRKDKRIERYFPKLSNVFNDYTIEYLIYLSNNRKETRHYVKDKTNVISHDSLNKKERIMMYKCSTCLLLNVIREKFGLPHLTIEYEQ